MENEKYEPYVCMMTNSTCYKNTEKMEVFGILWHDTGCNNDTLKRYVQPSDNDPRKDEILAKIGKNRNGNDWNHVYRKAGVNAFVGRFADDSVGAVQVMPWDYRPWGCGSGSLGSCNDHWIQFEICEDAKTNKEYALEAYNEACKLTAYLCDKFHLDPFGTVNFKGQKVPVILCHWDSYLLGLGSGHDDIYDWFPHIIGKGMDDVRKDVAALMQGHRNEWVKEGDKWYYYDLYGNMVKSDWGSLGGSISDLTERCSPAGRKSTVRNITSSRPMDTWLRASISTTSGWKRTVPRSTRTREPGKRTRSGSGMKILLDGTRAIGR